MTDIDPALRKVVAAAICPLSPPSELNSCCPQPMGEKRCQIDADAAIRAVRKWEAENGFVTVPREPTEAMFEAARPAFSVVDAMIAEMAFRNRPLVWQDGKPPLYYAWRAMIAAALPDPPQPKEGAER